MRVLHVTPSFAPAWRYGGPIQWVLRLCQALRATGIEAEVATTNCDGPDDLDVPVDTLTRFEDVPVRYFRRWPRVDYALSISLSRYLLSQTRRFDLIHVTSTFSFPALAAGVAARRSGIPYIVSPHGSLQGWSLQQKRWKKRPYWSLLERPHLERAAAIHATAEIERDDVLRALPRAEVFVVPIGMDPMGDLESTSRAPYRIVFLGRIHKKKGFDILVPALAEVARHLPMVETLVAGPDDEGEWARVEQLIHQTVPRPRVRYLGPVYGPHRFRLLSESTVFVLPSHSENFGMSVVEAMACGTPVVVSRNCPWESVEREGAGFWVENSVHAVAAALLRVLQDQTAAGRMGHAGRRLAEQYNWPFVGQAMARAYEQVLSASVRRRAGGATRA
jgi:glycosyltransferase involved in cell wall biosynthesis